MLWVCVQVYECLCVRGRGAVFCWWLIQTQGWPSVQTDTLPAPHSQTPHGRLDYHLFTVQPQRVVPLWWVTGGQKKNKEELLKVQQTVWLCVFASSPAIRHHLLLMRRLQAAGNEGARMQSEDGQFYRQCCCRTLCYPQSNRTAWPQWFTSASEVWIVLSVQDNTQICRWALDIRGGSMWATLLYAEGVEQGCQTHVVPLTASASWLSSEGQLKLYDEINVFLFVSAFDYQLFQHTHTVFCLLFVKWEKLCLLIDTHAFAGVIDYAHCALQQQGFLFCDSHSLRLRYTL